MKIDSTYKPATSAIAPKAQAAQPPATPASQDAVSLSQLASTLKGGEQAPVNSARVQEIKQAISEGRFKINPEAISERLLESALELVNRNGKRQA